MPLQRCPQCKVLTLVEEELRSGLCPECGTPLPGSGAASSQPPAAVPGRPRRGRGGWWFVVGLFLGAAATSSAAAAWWFWDRGGAGSSAAPPSGVGPVAAVSEVGTANATPSPISEERFRQTLAEAELAECRRALAEGELAESLARVGIEGAAAEQKLADLRRQLEQAQGRATAAEKALTGKGAEAGAEMRAAQARRVEMEGQLAAARVRLQEARDQVTSTERALEAKKAQLAAAEKAFEAKKGEQNGRAADTERQMGAVQAKLREAREQSAAADRALAATNARLTAAEKAVEAKKNEVAALDRSLEGKRNQVAALDKALESKKAETAAADKALETRRAQLAALANGRFGEPTVRMTQSPTDIAPAISAAAKQGHLPSPHAFVRQWRVIGPFPNEDRKKGHSTVYPPEKDPVVLGKDYSAIKGPARWHTFPSPGDYVDLANYFGGQPSRTELGYFDPGVAYAVCWVRSPTARPALISLGSNDGVKLWLNRREYLDRAVFRAAAPDQDRVPCELAAGWNEILVKVDNQGGGWGFFLELREPNGGRPLEGLEYRTRPPEGAAKR